MFDYCSIRSHKTNFSNVNVENDTNFSDNSDLKKDKNYFKLFETLKNNMKNNGEGLNLRLKKDKELNSEIVVFKS